MFERMIENVYQAPVTLNDFRLYLQLFTAGESEVNMVDFFIEAKSYCKNYRLWKAHRKKRKEEKRLAKRGKSGSSEDDKEDLVDDDDDDGDGQISKYVANRGQATPQGSTTKLEAIGPLAAKAPLPPIEKQPTDATVYDDVIPGTVMDGVSAVSSIAATVGLKSAGSRDTLQRADSKDELGGSSVTSGIINPKTSTKKLPAIQKPPRISTKEMSAEASRLIKRYLTKEAPRRLGLLDREDSDKITALVSHYIKALDTAQNTGLNFVPSPDRALKPIIRMVVHELYENQKLFPAFLEYCVATNMAGPCFQLPLYERISWMIYIAAWAVVGGLIMLIVILTRAHPYWMGLIFIPLFMISFIALLCRTNVSFLLWRKGLRECLRQSALDVLAKRLETRNPQNIRSTASLRATTNTEAQHPVEAFNAGDLILGKEDIEVRPVDEPLISLLQSRLIYRRAAMAFLLGLICTLSFVGFWPIG